MEREQQDLYTDFTTDQNILRNSYRNIYTGSILVELLLCDSARNMNYFL